MQSIIYILKNGNLSINSVLLDNYDNFDMMLEHKHICLFNNKKGVLVKTKPLKIRKQLFDMCKMNNQVKVCFKKDKIEIFSIEEDCKVLI
jgi:hypothetical protein